MREHEGEIKIKTVGRGVNKILMNKFTLMFLSMYLIFLLIPIDAIRDGYYYFIGVLFAAGITAKFWIVESIK